MPSSLEDRIRYRAHRSWDPLPAIVLSQFPTQ